MIKEVLINNSITVDLDEVEGDSKAEAMKNIEGWGLRALFDKKVFLSLLNELDQMRRLLNVKKQFYIFHITYNGKTLQSDSQFSSKMIKWHKKVEERTTNTLKFLNTSRLLKIIGYDATKYISMEQLNKRKHLHTYSLTRPRGCSVFRAQNSGQRMSLMEKIPSLDPMNRKATMRGRSLLTSQMDVPSAQESGSLNKLAHFVNSLGKFSACSVFLSDLTDKLTQLNKSAPFDIEKILTQNSGQI